MTIYPNNGLKDWLVYSYRHHPKNQMWVFPIPSPLILLKELIFLVKFYALRTSDVLNSVGSLGRKMGIVFLLKKKKVEEEAEKLKF